MASTYCWSCLARARPNISTLPSPRVVTSTPPVRRKSVTSAKTTPKTPKFRESKNVRIKKWNKGKEKAVKVTPELKAQRKRIILSNTNALTVPIEDLSPKNMADGQSREQILGIPVTLIDKLRALDAFKITQKWGAFRKPATLMRKQTVAIGRLIDRQATERKTVRRILTGERGTGKSVVLLQTMAMALLKGWIVISVPDARDITIATTTYSPLPNTNPTQYVQKHYTAKLLSQMLSVNRSVLSNLSLSTPPPPGSPLSLRPNMSLAQLAEIGANDSDVAWNLFMILWQELTTSTSQSRPPILLAIDSVSHLMAETQYRNSDFKPIHAHDLALVRHLMSHFSGAKPLGPSGGMLLASTSESNCPRVYSFELALKQILARQDQLSAVKSLSSLDSNESTFPAPDTWTPLDTRVMEVLTGLPNGLVNEADDKRKTQYRGVEVQRIDGLSKTETRSLIEYYAKSGLLRDVVDDTMVSNMWTLSGSGNLGEVEKAVLTVKRGDDRMDGVKFRKAGGRK